IFEGGSLGAIGMKRFCRRENLGNSRIFDPRPRFVAPEVIGGTVRLFVYEQVVERANPRRKASDLPNTFERRSPLVFGHLGRRLFEGIIVEPPDRRSALLVCERITLL